jgi:hypothetical protein
MGDAVLKFYTVQCRPTFGMRLEKIPMSLLV